MAFWLHKKITFYEYLLVPFWFIKKEKILY